MFCQSSFLHPYHHHDWWILKFPPGKVTGLGSKSANIEDLSTGNQDSVRQCSFVRLKSRALWWVTWIRMHQMAKAQRANRLENSAVDISWILSCCIDGFLWNLGRDCFLKEVFGCFHFCGVPLKPFSGENHWLSQWAVRQAGSQWPLAIRKC